MSESISWLKFFDSHAPFYMENCFVTGTMGEVDFVLEHIDLPPGSSILDMGCGTGRHSVELARRGYRMTGVDLSTGMLNQAQKAAKEAGVEIEFIQSNATTFKTDKKFDGAICLCEGAFCLLEMDEDPLEHNEAVLKNIINALKPGGKLILTCLNGLRTARLHTPEDVKNGIYDPFYMIEINETEYDTLDGKKTARTREKGFVPSELDLLLKRAGFQVEHIGGGTAGNFGIRPLDMDEYEIISISRRPK